MSNTNINELTNIPINFEIAGRTIQIKRLNISEIFGYFENIVKQNYMKNIKEVASLFDNPIEKNKYLIEATKTMPTKTQLQIMAQDYLQTEEGVAEVLKIGLNKCQKLSEDDIINILKDAKSEDIQLMMNYLFGIEASDQPSNTESTEKKIQ
jgi:hypothetical protein